MPPRIHNAALGRARAFTLVELIGVVVLLSVLAIGAIPSVRSLDRARERAGRDRVVDVLAVARETATATGAPHGVEFDLDGGTMALVRIDEASGAVAPATDLSGRERAPEALAGGVRVTGVQGASGDAVWFGSTGLPLTEAPSGGGESEASSDVVVALERLDGVVVRAVSGAIER